MFLARNAANYVPTEMLRSRDLSNMSAMLRRSASLAESQYEGSGMGGLIMDVGNNLSQASAAGLPSPQPGEVLEGSWIGGAGGSQLNAVQVGGSGGPFESSFQSNTGGFGPEPGHSSSYPPQGFQYNQSFLEASAVVDESLFDEQYFETQLNECMVEIRLTSKHYTLCVRENFIAEAMRSLRRRWFVAKRLWNLVMLQRQHRLQIQETMRAEQEARMLELLLRDQVEPAPQYDENGRPLYLTADLLEQSAVEGPEGEEQIGTEGQDDLGPLTSTAESKYNALGESSDMAVNLSQPHAKYLPARSESAQSADSSVAPYAPPVAVLSAQSSVLDMHIQAATPPRPQIGGKANAPVRAYFCNPGYICFFSGSAKSGVSISTVGSRSRVEPSVRISEGVTPVAENADKSGTGEEGEDEEGDEEEDSATETTATVGVPAVTLERILLAYDAQQLLFAAQEANPDIENRSGSTLLRPADYDSVGEYAHPVVCDKVDVL
jgi:hypothetical protein